MNIRDILLGRTNEIIAVDGSLSVSQAVQEMVNSNVGSVLVLLNGAVEGIFTERDALRLWSAKDTSEHESVLKYMTQNLVIVTLDDSLEQAMSVMIQRNIRHLLVVDDLKLVNVLSIKDLVKAYVGTLQGSIRSMAKVNL